MYNCGFGMFQFNERQGSSACTSSLRETAAEHMFVWLSLEKYECVIQWLRMKNIFSFSQNKIMIIFLMFSPTNIL